MSDALERLRNDMQDFSVLLARLRTFSYTKADLTEAYNRLARIHDRYGKEKDLLEPSERDALAKAFEHDPLIRDMGGLVQPLEDSPSTDHMAILNETDRRILNALDLATKTVRTSSVLRPPTASASPDLT